MHMINYFIFSRCVGDCAHILLVELTSDDICELVNRLNQFIYNVYIYIYHISQMDLSVSIAVDMKAC